MAVSFNYSADRVVSGGVQQVRRMQELEPFARFSGPDDSSGRVKATCKGVCKLPQPSLADRSVLFFIAHDTKLLPSVADWLALNTVVVDGQAYVLTTEIISGRNSHRYTPKSIQRTSLDLRKLNSVAVPLQTSYAPVPPGTGVQSAGSADIYMGTESPYNNVDDNSNNIGAAPQPFVPATASQSLYQNPGASTQRFGIGTHRFRP